MSGNHRQIADCFQKKGCFWKPQLGSLSSFIQLRPCLLVGARRPIPDEQLVRSRRSRIALARGSHRATRLISRPMSYTSVGSNACRPMQRRVRHRPAPAAAHVLQPGRVVHPGAGAVSPEKLLTRSVRCSRSPTCPLRCIGGLGGFVI